MTLLEVAELFAKSLRYEIRKRLREGDDEGANMVSLTLDAVEAAIVQAKKS